MLKYALVPLAARRSRAKLNKSDTIYKLHMFQATESQVFSVIYCFFFVCVCLY
jgi:hypothetical protein